jgi:hypothetical protein
VRRQYQSLDIQCWEHTGSRLGVNRPFLCLQADSAACDVLLSALDELSAEGASARRMLTLKPCHRQKACSTIRLLLSAASDELKQMSLTKDQSTAVFEFTLAGLMMFREAIETWRNGGEDFSVKPATRRKAEVGKKDLASGEVWFWTPRMDP